MPTNKKNKNKINKKARSRDILIQRASRFRADVAWMDRSQENTVVQALQIKEKALQIKEMAKHPDRITLELPDPGKWCEYKLSAYDIKPGFDIAKINELERSYVEASQDNDWDKIAVNALELVKLTVDGGPPQYRYDKIVFLDAQFPEYMCPLPAQCERLLEEMLSNPKELPFFKALDAHLLARSLTYGDYTDEDDPDSPSEDSKVADREYKKHKLALINSLHERCQAVPDKDREKPIQMYERNGTMGGALDQILQSWNDDKWELEEELQKPLEFYDEEAKLSELLRHTDIQDVLPSPPTLDGETLRSVAELPQIESYFLVAKQKMSYLEQCHLGKDFCKEGEEANANRERLLRNGEKHAVFQVNHPRYLKGKRRGVFDQVQVCLLAKDDPLPRKVLAPLAMACLQPCQFLAPGSSSPKVPPNAGRPKKVFFESAEITSHPQVKLFLSMMGCTNVEMAAPEMIQLLKDTEGELLAPSKSGFPHMHDEAKGIKCGGCDKYGTCLQECPCRKVYYCSRKCQEKEWASHKAIHNQAMARKRAKMKGKVVTSII